MSFRNVLRLLPGMLATLFMLVDCGGSQTSLPVGAFATREIGSSPLLRQRPWMSPLAQSADLLYVSDQSGSIYVYSFPKGQLVGMLTGFSSPAGLCSDKSGNVFITDTLALEIFEYAHAGKKPIATLVDPGGYPEGCSVDATTGDLAVTNYEAIVRKGPGNVSVFSHGSHNTTTYADPAVNQFFFCSYDGKGNLYADGVNAGTTQSEFVELTPGSTQLANITLNKRVGYPGGIQWNGGSLIIEDMFTDRLYHVAISGSTGTITGVTVLKHNRSNLLAQFWIQGGTVIAPYGRTGRLANDVGFWSYPSGGLPTKILGAPGSAELFGVAVSLAPK
jgi:hypothetical protein